MEAHREGAAMKKYLSTTLQEIKSSPALRWYGAFLALSHALSAFFWMDHSVDLVVANSHTLCWPVFPICESLKFQSFASAASFLSLYSFLGILTALFFAFRKVPVGYFLLCSLLGLKLFITSLSYGLMGNYHYMVFFIHIAFLFLPAKKQLIPFFIGIFYWGAGILKFNPEWLSGVALTKESFLPFWLQHLSLIYAVILETILVFGLFSSQRKIRFLVLGQFLIFHLFSWHIVGYFYPLTMLLLLSFFLLIEFFNERWESIFEATTLKNSRILFPCIILLTLQILPYAFSSDPATSGGPRLSSLNMLDARVQCESLLVRQQSGAVEVYDPFAKTQSVRTQCDPLIFLSQIKNICTDKKEVFDFWLSSKRTTDEFYQTRLHLKDICKMNPETIPWAEFL